MTEFAYPEANWIVERATADRDARIDQAKGESARFLSVLEEYRKIPRATRKRIYLETMEEVLPRVTRYIVDADRENRLGLRVLDLETKPK